MPEKEEIYMKKKKPTKWMINKLVQFWEKTSPKMMQLIETEMEKFKEEEGIS